MQQHTYTHSLAKQDSIEKSHVQFLIKKFHKHGDDEAVVVEFVEAMTVVSPPRPLQVAADVLHKADVGPHGLQSVRFVLWSGKPRVGGPSNCLCDINSARVRSENSNGTVMWTVREMVDERTIVAAQMACHRVSSDDGQTQLRKDHGSTETPRTRPCKRDAP